MRTRCPIPPSSPYCPHEMTFFLSQTRPHAAPGPTPRLPREPPILYLARLLHSSVLLPFRLGEEPDPKSTPSRVSGRALILPRRPPPLPSAPGISPTLTACSFRPSARKARK